MTVDLLKIVGVLGLFLVLIFYPSKGRFKKTGAVVTVKPSAELDSLKTVCSQIKSPDIDKCKTKLMGKCALVFSQHQYCDRVVGGGRDCLLHLQAVEQCVLKKL